MKQIIILILILSFLFVSCKRDKEVQPEPLTDFGYGSEARWPARKILKERTAKLSNFKLKQFRNSILKYSEFRHFIEWRYSINVDSFYNSIHFVHLNNDDLPDAIFCGQSNGEGNEVRIYVNQDGQFEQFFEDYTDIKDLTFEKERLSSITIVKLPCCSDNIEEETKYLVDEKFNFPPARV